MTLNVKVIQICLDGNILKSIRQLWTESVFFEHYLVMSKTLRWNWDIFNWHKRMWAVANGPRVPERSMLWIQYNRLGIASNSWTDLQLLVKVTEKPSLLLGRRSSQPISWLVQNTQPSQPITWLTLTELQPRTTTQNDLNNYGIKPLTNTQIKQMKLKPGLGPCMSSTSQHMDSSYSTAPGGCMRLWNRSQMNEMIDVHYTAGDVRK